MVRFIVHKEPCYEGYRLYEGYKASEGFSKELLDIIIDMLEKYLQKHSQCLMVLMQFTFPVELDVEGIDNSCFQSFIEAYKRHLESRGLDPEYLWVREVGETSERCHYHLMLLLNGNKIRYFNDPIMVKKYWRNSLQTTFNYNGQAAPMHLHILPTLRRGMAIKRGDHSNFEQAISVASYLAKIRTKIPIGRNIKAYSTSQYSRG